MEKVGKAIFSEIAAEEVNWIAGKKKSDWGGGFARWTRDKEEAKLSGKARKKAKWAYYRALESDWESNGLFEKSGAGETGRLTRELLRYQMIHGFGNSQFGLSPKERDLWQAGEHDLIQPLRLGFIEQIAHSIIITVGTMGIGTALSAVDAISKFGATALTTLAGTGMQVGASFVSSGSNLWGGADPYLEGQKLASALSKSVIAGGLGVLSAGAGEILGEGLVGKVLVDGGLAAGRSMIGGALSSAVLGEALDGKGLLLNAAFAGLGGGIASGLGQIDGLGSLGEDMLNSGVHFGLDTGKAALMALDGDGNFDDTQFLADWGGSFAGNGFSALGSLASYGVRGGLNDYSNQRASDAAEKMKESYTATQSLSKTGLSDDLMDRLGGVGGIFDSFGLLTESMVRGAALGRAQTMDGTGFGVGLGRSIGGFVAVGQSVDSIDSTARLYENGRIIKGYQAGPNAVDGSYQAMLNAYSNAKYNRQMRPADRAALREQLERKMVFTDRIQFRDKNSNNVHYKAFTTENNGEALSVFNANLLNNDIGKQLDIATVLQHEGYRNGRNSRGPPSGADLAETRRAVEAHWMYQKLLSEGRHGKSYVDALDKDSYNDYQKGQNYLAGRTSEEEAHRYIDGNYSSKIDAWGESTWDAISLGTGIGSLIYNVKNGNYGRAALDAVGALADGAALVLPLVPGGAGIAIKAARGVGAAAGVTDGTLNIKDGIENKEPIATALGTLQTVSGLKQFKGLRTDNVGEWSNPSRLSKHVKDHGWQFRSTSAKDYTNKARKFYKEAIQNDYRIKVDKNGVTRIYDPETNTFGSYDKNGQIKTFFKPDKGKFYWTSQSGEVLP